MKNNHRSTLKFILILLISMSIGAAVGVSMAMLFEKYSPEQLFASIYSWFIENTLSIMLLVAIPIFLLALVCVLFMKRLYLTEIEANEDKADKFQSFAIAINSFLLTFLFMSFGIYMTSQHTGNIDSTYFLTLTGIFLVLSLMTTFIEVYTVRTYQRFHPEKKGDPLDMKFHKDWVNSLDEGEKMLTYVAGFKTSMFMRNMFLITWMVLVLIGMFISISPLTFIIVSVFWLASNISYIIYSSRLEKGKISY